jgi:hypothetical protein
MAFGFSVYVALQKLLDCSFFDKQRVAIYGDLLHQKNKLKSRGLPSSICDGKGTPRCSGAGFDFLRKSFSNL